ncbi:hypothetical protein RM549_03110 [Salegentibacter sp. F188]|uniref:Uncharacterized protein n=1 Tax=Autumnicola patrickiae TaxID=3075591 RepID=A0ABU3DYH6_9FLAO|nr:hypothetical protein [Salegentibacter sp. F188]MDT0688755.1 hypothetical protein [Salegentibacter sp. F188]
MLEYVPTLISKFSGKQPQKEFYKWQKMFREEDGEKILSQEEYFFRIPQKSSNSKKVEDLKDFFLLFKDFYKGFYKDVALLTIASIGGYFLYVLRPVVFTPIPPNVFSGYLKDAAFFEICLDIVKEDLEKYREWKKA